MHTIKISEIIEGERQRKEYDAARIKELADSIQDAGLHHAPRIVSMEDPRLVVGGRRLRALRLLSNLKVPVIYDGVELPLGVIPVTLHHSGDAYDVQLAELYENIHREDISWTEQVAAVKGLHELRKTLDPEHTVTDTSREIFGEGYHSASSARTGEAIRIATAMETDPEVAKAKSRKEALKIMQKKAGNATYALLAKSAQQASGEGEGTMAKSPHQLIQGNALEVLPTLDSGKFDCIITDPPYGIGADTFGDQGQGTHTYDDSKAAVDQLIQSLANEGYRVATELAHLYCFCDIRFFREFSAVFEEAGWYVWSTPLIWYKGNQGLLPRPFHGPRRCYEAIIFATKGDSRVLFEGQHDVISIPGVGASRHAAEKPVPLYMDLLRRSCRQGARILDPFAGSGTVFPAANSLGLLATGVNLDEVDYNLAYSRLEERVN